jgi:hypothetical protein
MRKKDLVLISSYTPDIRRQNTLRDLVHSINRENFDIMISSHSIVPIDILENVDYLIYDKNNELDFDVKNKFQFLYKNDSFSIFTTEPKRYNHFVPVIRNIVSGLSYSKNLGYKKVHHFEYDSLIKKEEELLENSKLLDEYSLVYYEIKHLQYPNSPISFNLDKISDMWFNLDDENFEDFLRQEKSTKTGEEYQWKLINLSGNFYRKNFDVLEDNQIYCALNYDLESNKWIIPFYSPYDKILHLFSWIESESDIGSERVILLNDTTVINVNHSNVVGCWKTYPLGYYKDVLDIKIIVNGKITRNYNFRENDIEEFIQFNRIEY